MKCAFLTRATAVALSVAACGGEPDADRGDSEMHSAVVIFEPGGELPAFGDVPFPSDLYRDETGVRLELRGLERLVTDHAEALADGFAAVDGFGRSTAVHFFVRGELDATTLPDRADAALGPEASALIVDIDRSSPAHGKRYPARARWLASLGCVSLLPLPGVVLEPGKRHAAVLKSRVRASDGTTLGSDVALRSIAQKSAAQRKTPAEKLYGDALDELVALGAIADAKEAAGLAVYTTSKQAAELVELRAALRGSGNAPALLLDPAEIAPYAAAIFGVATDPSLADWLGTPEKDENGREWPGGDNATGIAHDGIGAVATGAFVAPSFLDPTSKHFERETSSEYRLANVKALVPVTLVLPRTAPPPSGYPVIIHGHGLSNHRASMLTLANEFARAGFAVIGIDDVEHGARAGILDQKNNYPGSYAGPDGMPDNQGIPITFFAGFADFVVIRDNFRQTLLDQMSLVRLVQNPALDLTALSAATGGIQPKLDPSRIFWSGGSLGGIMGTMVTAVEPEIRAAALQVPGGGFVSMIATGSAKMHGLVETIARGTFGIVGDELIDEFHPVANLMMAATEAGDPLAYAPHVFGAPLGSEATRSNASVLVTYALSDEVLPNLATHALVRALGIQLADPHLEEIEGVEVMASPIAGNLAGRTGVAVQYAPANHGLGYGLWDTREFVPGIPLVAEDDAGRFPLLAKPIRIETPVREHAEQTVAFFTSALGSEAPEVVVTIPPIPDFDADGVLDEDERAAGTDPYDPESR